MFHSGAQLGGGTFQDVTPKTVNVVHVTLLGMFRTDLHLHVFPSFRLWISADELHPPSDLTESSSSRARGPEAAGRALMRSASGELLLLSVVSS